MRRLALHMVSAAAGVLVGLWAIGLSRDAKFVVDGRTHLALGSGGLAFVWSRRNEAGVIVVDLPPIDSLEGRASFGMTDGRVLATTAEVRGAAYIGMGQRPWLPITGGGPSLRIVFVPLWPALVIAVMTAAMWWRARRSVPAGHCTRCRYDLRASPGGAPCPECGLAPAFTAH